MTVSQHILKVQESTADSSWLPGVRYTLLFLILLLSSTQLGLHFWPETALVYGVRIDYLSPTLYLLDLLILIYLFVVKFEKFEIWDLRFNQLIIILIANLIFSVNPFATLTWSLHFLLYFIFASSLRFSDIRQTVISTLLFSSLFQICLAATQLYLGHSLQGFFYYLGERMVSVGQPGVALATFMDQVILRAYGTFGHPNILAGWFVIVALIIHKLYKIQKHQLFVHIGMYWCTFAITIIGIFLTQSRSAAIAYFGIIIPFYVLKKLQFRMLYVGVIFTLLISNWSLLALDRADLSFTERINLQKLSLHVIQKTPIFGTGTNASISAYPDIDPSFRLLQPDHNSFTLFFSWFGLTGILAIIYIVRIYDFTDLRRYDFLPLIPLFLLDHYLLTSPQGLLILLLYLKVVNYSHAQSHR